MNLEFLRTPLASQAELAQVLNTSRPSVNQWLSGRVHPSRPFATRLKRLKELLEDQKTFENLPTDADRRRTALAKLATRVSL